MSRRTRKTSPLFAYLTGAASILDLTGCPRWFKELAPARTRPRNPEAAIGSDFAAVGKYLNIAIQRYASRKAGDRRAAVRKPRG